MNPAVEASLAFAGIDLTQEQAGQLDDLATWLRAEALPAGGIGPSEGPRVHDRHLADSIVYAGAWDSPPERCWDLGSGVGLPGLVLAIVWPACRVTLVDRSARKLDLARRAARVIGIGADTRMTGIEALKGSVEAIVSRAAMPAQVLLPHVLRLLSPGGLAVVSGSGSSVAGYEELVVPSEILDHNRETPYDTGFVSSQPDSLADFPPATIVALANQKGGVGKSTTAINLAAALAFQGQRVLIIDLDPQGNATSGLGVDRSAITHSVYDVLLKDIPIEDAIEPTSVKNLFIVPATIDLAGAEIELVPAFSREGRLKAALKAIVGDFRVIFIDCPPSLGLLTVNALTAANEVLIPIQCEYYALEGLTQLLSNVDLVKRQLNPALRVEGVVLTMYDARTNLSRDVANQVRQHFVEDTYRTVIPRSVRISEAPSYGEPIEAFDPMTRGAIAYRELGREFRRRHHLD